MKEKLALLAWSICADAPDLCAAPFVYATAAAALDCEVEIHFAGPAVLLLVDGVAAKAFTSSGKPVYGFMREAANLGVKFFACAMAAGQHVAAGQAMIPELSGEAGATAFVARALAPGWKTLVF
ncbi:MAG: DsrE family protein [Rhodocyclaceae bacterium]|nr:DsrE family protein [Rhodocyclaceae bacterium]